MVIGNGLIAKRFSSYADDERFLIFASGVANSKSTDQAEYRREFDLLLRKTGEHPEKTAVYFSTCSINDPAENTSAYVAHKKKIESYLQSNMPHYLIFRVSNLVGRSPNVNTVLNFIAHNISEGKPFDLWTNAKRNLIDVDDFFAIVDHILQNGLFTNRIINIANPVNYTVPDIVAAVGGHLGKQANFKEVPKGGSFDIDISDINPFFVQLNINFSEAYLANLLHKYY